MRQFLYPLEKVVKRHGQSAQKVATVAICVATLQATFSMGCRRCRHTYHSFPHEKIRSDTEKALRSIEITVNVR